MPRELPKTDADADDFIQFRGPQTRVTHDATGVFFQTTKRHGLKVHEAVPVVGDDVDPADAPDDAIAHAVAEQLVETNPLVCWGVACPTCGDVFDSPQGELSHQSVHDDQDGSGTDAGGA